MKDHTIDVKAQKKRKKKKRTQFFSSWSIHWFLFIGVLVGCTVFVLEGVHEHSKDSKEILLAAFKYTSRAPPIALDSVIKPTIKPSNDDNSLFIDHKDEEKQLLESAHDSNEPITTTSVDVSEGKGSNVEENSDNEDDSASNTVSQSGDDENSSDQISESEIDFPEFSPRSRRALVNENVGMKPGDPEHFFNLKNYPVAPFNGRYRRETIPKSELKEMFPSTAKACPALLNRTAVDVCCDTPRVERGEDDNRFAYVVMISGIDEDELYYGYMANIVIMRDKLRRMDHTACDFIVMVIMDEVTELQRFPKLWEDLMKKWDIQIWYTEPLLRPNTFHSTQFAKINIFRLTQYDRVVYLDADQWPYGPHGMADYWFTKHPNAHVGATGPTEPMSGGFFMVAPTCAAYRMLRHKSLWRYQHVWDKEYGWGAPIGYEYNSRAMQLFGWDYHAADTDQGLLFHYFRHLCNCTSDILYRHATYLRYKPNSLHWEVVYARDPVTNRKNSIPFRHFSGKKKPWMLRHLDSQQVQHVEWRGDFNRVNFPIPFRNLSKMEDAHMLTKRQRPERNTD